MGLIRKRAEKIRFAAVGAANTVLDFALLFLFVSFGIDKIVSNYFSTGIAFIFSFFINRSFTFKHTGGNVKRQFVLFIAITIFGLWVIQPVIIAGCSILLVPFAWPETVVLFVSKVIATGASLVWNYMLYSRVVFKSR